MFAKFGQHRKQAGDTIIEVMVVVAILGLAFSIAYATATHSLAKTRSSEEHAEALQYLNSQVELLRNDAVNPSDIQRPGVTFCMDPATDKAVTSADSSYTNVCKTVGVEGFYQVGITYLPHVPSPTAPNDDVYKVTVTWPGVSDLGTQQEHLYYKLHAL